MALLARGSTSLDPSIRAASLPDQHGAPTPAACEELTHGRDGSGTERAERLLVARRSRSMRRPRSERSRRAEEASPHLRNGRPDGDRRGAPSAFAWSALRWSSSRRSSRRPSPSRSHHPSRRSHSMLLTSSPLLEHGSERLLRGGACRACAAGCIGRGRSLVLALLARRRAGLPARAKRRCDRHERGVRPRCRPPRRRPGRRWGGGGGGDERSRRIGKRVVVRGTRARDAVRTAAIGAAVQSVFIATTVARVVAALAATLASRVVARERLDQAL